MMSVVDSGVNAVRSVAYGRRRDLHRPSTTVQGFKRTDCKFAIMSLSTELTKLLKIKHPVMLAGMGGAAGPPLAAAVTNAGGIGTIGGAGLSPMRYV